MTPTPFSDCDSMCSMSLTVVVMPRSELETMRSAISLGAMPVKFQMTLITGILISGKMSTGVRRSTNGITKMMTSAITTKVYGRLRARETIHIWAAGSGAVNLY
jgi:hypothetical protein